MSFAPTKHSEVVKKVVKKKKNNMNRLNWVHDLRVNAD